MSKPESPTTNSQRLTALRKKLAKLRSEMWDIEAEIAEIVQVIEWNEKRHQIKQVDKDE